MKYISLFAGIGGFDLAFDRAGFECAAQVENDAGCRSVLARHWPSVPQFDDARTVGAHNLPQADVIVGGFPCQDLSVAGKRAGLNAGARSGLFYEMVRISDELKPSFLIWENVPGLFSSGDGRDFTRVLRALDDIGYCGAWTNLDAQFFGLAQRRRRIFGVFAHGDIGAASCAEVLSLAARLPGHFAPRRKAGAEVAATIRGGSAGGSGHGKQNGSDRMTLLHDGPFTFDWQAGSSGDTSFRGKSRAWVTDKPGRARSLTANRTLAVVNAFNGYIGRADDNDGQAGPIITPPITSHHGRNTADNGQPFIPVAFDARGNGDGVTDYTTVVAFQTRIARNGRGQPKDIVDALSSSDSGLHGDSKPHVALQMNFIRKARVGDQTGTISTNPGNAQFNGIWDKQMGVRRLTPRECERLQGFPNDWTRWGKNGEEISDSARYRMLGNAVAVPVVEWIARQVATELARLPRM